MFFPFLREVANRQKDEMRLNVQHNFRCTPNSAGRTISSSYFILSHLLAQKSSNSVTTHAKKRKKRKGRTTRLTSALTNETI